MANAVASSSRDRPARNRSSMHSLHQHTREGVVMTREITRAARPTHVRNDTVKIVNQYELKHKVGKGQHGEVYLAEDSHNAYMQVAVKCVRRKNKSDRLNKLRRNHQSIPRTSHTRLVDQLGSTEHKIRKEIAIMKKLRHPHVVRLLEVIDDPQQDKIYMVMEYLGGGEIKWRSRSDNPLLRVDQTRRICRDVILGLEYLHYQGIIHRDIKPANLLWTADRRTVKISDFGVSTFSYAQRLSAAGKGNIKDEDTDPILMDESDLSKTAGTPMFLAPEIVADVPLAGENSGSTVQLSFVQQPRKKPPITKAIDIWAFGVTLYGLLFGLLPFSAKTEYEIYQVIRWQDWDVQPDMGLDSIPTGGRHPKLLQRSPADSEGTLVVDLLERLLEKDARKRITLDQVKRHPWITKDLEKPEEWIRETTLTKYLQLKPTVDETSSAMSPLRFTWLPKFGRLLSTTLRNVRPQRSFRRSPQRMNNERDEVGVHSEPHIVHLARYQTTTGNPSHNRREHRQPHNSHHSHRQSQHQPNSVREKKRESRQELARNKSTNDIVTKPDRPFEPWAIWNAGTSAGPSKSKSTDTGLHVPSQLSSPLPSPGGSSMATTPLSEYAPGYSPDSERPRNSPLQWMKRWGSHRHSSYNSTHTVAITEAGPSQPRAHVSATAPSSRNSTELLGGPFTSLQGTIGGKFIKGIRAASWTASDFAYARPSEDMMSLNSGDRHDDLDDETLLVGAGGFAHSPVSSVPNSALLSTVSSAQSIGPPLIAARPVRPHADDANVPDGSPPDACPRYQTHASQSQAAVSARTRMTSPLARVARASDDEGGSGEGSVPSSDSYDSADDSSSSLYNRSRPPARRQSTARPSPSRRRAAVDTDPDAPVSETPDSESFDDLQPSTSQMYQDEDEESEDEEEVHLEVRTRRPSASAAEMSPPRRSLSAHRALSSPPRREGKQRPMICT